MSLRPRSELHLRLGARRCVAEVWRAGFARSPAHSVTCRPGEAVVGDDLLGATLERLQALCPTLPRRARLVVDDDSLYHALLPADAAWGRDDHDARRHFAGSLDQGDLLVSMALAPCGRHWLAVALERAWLAMVEARLVRHAVTLGRVSAALLEDLQTLGRRVPADGLVVLVREAGLVLMRREAGRWTALRWERCNSRVAEDVALSIELRAHAGPASAVLLVAESALQATGLSTAVARRGWSLATLATGYAA